MLHWERQGISQVSQQSTSEPARAHYSPGGPGACTEQENKVVLYAVRRDPSDSGGYIMSLDDFRSVRKQPVIRWRAVG